MDELVLQQQKQQKQEQLERLKTLQTWEHAEGAPLLLEQQATAQDITQFERQYEAAGFAQLQAQAPQAQVVAAAHVPHPPVQAPAAAETGKELRQREKKQRKARKETPVGDEHTLDLVNALRTQSTRSALNLTPELLAQAQAHRCDTRSLRIFCEPFQVRRGQQPATPQDAAILADNRAFIEDYVSGNAQRRKPHLDRIMKELLSDTVRLTPDSLTDEKIVRNVAYYKDLGDRFTYIENIERENPDYFANLPPLERDLYEAQRALYVQFTGALTQHLNARGIDLNSARIYSYEEMAPIEMGEQFREPFTQQYQEALQHTKEVSSQIFEQEAERQCQVNYATLREEYQVRNAELREETGVDFPDGATLYQYKYTEKYRNMIADHPEAYGADPVLIDRVFQDLYRTFSVLGKAMLELNSRQSVQNNINVSDPREVIKQRVSKAAMMQVEAQCVETDLLSHYSNGLTDLLEHKLRGKPLSPSAAAVLARYQNAPQNPAQDE